MSCVIWGDGDDQGNMILEKIDKYSSGHSSSDSEEGDDGKHGREGSERGADNNEEVYGYTCIEGVSKDVDFDSVERNNNCQQYSKRIQSRSFLSIFT